MQPNIVANYIPSGVKDWTPGRGGHKPIYIVLHTTDCSLRSAEATFASGSRQAAAHDIVALNGDLVREVAEGDTAWGAANWPVNQAGFNIEHEDNGNPFDAIRTPEEYNTSAWRVADLSRRYGIPAKRGTVVNHVPQTPGIYTHGEVSLTGTGCPDGLDVDRIVSEAQALLGGAVPRIVEAVAASTPGINPWGPGKVKVTTQTLRVHNSAAITDAGNFANTPDGMLHLGNLADVNGWVRGQLVSQDGVTSDVWLHSTHGHFFWAADTDFFEAAAVPLLAEAVIPAPYDFVSAPGTVMVTPEIGANLRSQPEAAGNNIVRAEGHGWSAATPGYISNGGDVAGSTKWWQIGDSLYVSDQVVSFTPDPVPVQEPAPIPVATAPGVAPAPATPFTPPDAGIGADIRPPQSVFTPTPMPIPAELDAGPMTIRDYLVAGLAWMISKIPFVNK